MSECPRAVAARDTGLEPKEREEEEAWDEASIEQGGIRKRSRQRGGGEEEEEVGRLNNS